MALIKIPKKDGSYNKAKNLPQNTPPQTAIGPPIPPTGSSPYLPIIDKLTVTLRVPQADYGAISKLVHLAIKDDVAFVPAKKSAMYEVVQLIALRGSTERVHFMFRPKKSYYPDARLDLNPAKLGAKGMAGLDKVLGTIFPGGWGYIVQHGRVSRLDIAIDFPEKRMHHFHLLPNQVLTTKTYEAGGKLKTIYSGKPKGNQLKMYSKSYEQWIKVAKKKGPKGPPTVRVEQRLTKVGKPLKDLPKLENPFTKFQLVTYPPEPPANASKVGKAVWPFFKDSVAAHGLGPALKLLPPNQMTIYRKHFAACVSEWWNPEAIWANWPNSTKLLHV